MLMTASVGQGGRDAWLSSRRLRASRESGKTFREALARHARITRVDSRRTQLRTIDAPEEYLGVAETLRVRLFSSKSP